VIIDCRLSPSGSDGVGGLLHGELGMAWALLWKMDGKAYGVF